MPDTENNDGLTVVAEVPQPEAQTVFDTLYDAGLTPVYLPSPDDILPDGVATSGGIPIAVPPEHAAQAREILLAAEAQSAEVPEGAGELVYRQLLAVAMSTTVAAGILRLLTGSWRRIDLAILGLLAAVAFFVVRFLWPSEPPATQDSADEDA